MAGLASKASDLDKTNKPKIFTTQFFINAFVNLMLYVNYYVLMVAMAGYCFAIYQTDAATAGFAASIFIVGALFARFLGGALIDFFGRKNSLVVGAMVMVLCAVLYLVQAGLALLFVLRIIHGFAYGISQTAISSIATEAVPAQRKGEGVGYFMLSATLGSAVGPFMGTIVAEYLNYSVLFILCAVCIAIGFLCTLLVHEPHQKKPLEKNGSEAEMRLESEDSSSKKTTMSGKSSAGAFDNASNNKVANIKPDKRVTRISHLRMRLTSVNFSLSSFIEYRALPISCSVALAILAYGAVITYLDSFALQENMIEAASLFFVVYSIIMFLARPFTGKAFDKRGDFGVMIAGFSSFAIGMVCMGLAHNGLILLLAACFLGFGVGTINPCGLTLALQKSPSFRLTAANSTFSCLNDATIGLAPVLLGWLIPLIGYNGLYFVLTGVVLIAMGLYALFRFKGFIK